MLKLYCGMIGFCFFCGIGGEVKVYLEFDFNFL